ncbi:MAG: protein translocase subunit SecF [Gammaproteobacteria bacterium]
MSNISSIPFMRYRHIAACISGALVLMALILLMVRGLNYGLDFTGGTQVSLHYSGVPSLDEIRSTLTTNGFPNHEVVNVGDDQDVMIRVQDSGEAVAKGSSNEDLSKGTATKVVEVLKAATKLDVTITSSSFVSSQVGQEMKELGVLGGLLSLFMIMLYIAFRFQFKFSVGAVVSLAHDTILTLGFFALTRMNFDLTVLAAVLAVIGYSLNDTIVVADRIRENFRLLRGLEPAEIIDISITQTMARSIITSLTVVLVLLALLFVGGEVVRGFSAAMLVGVFFGTTSSIYVAASILMYMNVSRLDLVVPVKKQEELDSMP